MSAQANFMRVRIDKLEDEGAGNPPKRDLLCVVRALLKKIKQRVLVGDFVRVSGIDWADGRGMVESVQDRRSALSNPPVANVDHCLLCFSLAQPPFEPPTVTRFAVSAEAAGLPVTILLNKADLVPPPVVQKTMAQVSSWGYTSIAVSCHTELGLDLVAESLRGRTSVVAGPSGAGKSSVLNQLRLRAARKAAEEHSEQDALDGDSAGSADTSGNCSPSASDDTPDADRLQSSALAGTSGSVTMQSVGKVTAIGRGRNTTRHVELVQVDGGLLADTPGFNQPKLDGLSLLDLPLYFPEIRAALDIERCAFANCQHLHEPGCAVGQDWERHAHYALLHAELTTKDDLDRHRAISKRTREGRVRNKTRAGGQVVQEALLDVKSHRRVNRRELKQSVYDALNDDE